MTIRVVDNGSPPLDDRQTFAIFVLLPPRFVGISRAGDQVTLTWQTAPGKRYRLEYKNHLAETNWTLGNDYSASGDTLSVIDVTTGVSQRFYRLLVLQ